MVFLCSRLIALALLIPKVTLESQIGPPSPKLRPIENVYFTEHRNIYFAEHRMSTLLNYVVKLLVLQGSDNFRAKFTVWLACPRAESIYPSMTISDQVISSLWWWGSPEVATSCHYILPTSRLHFVCGKRTRPRTCTSCVVLCFLWTGSQKYLYSI